MPHRSEWLGGLALLARAGVDAALYRNLLRRIAAITMLAAAAGVTSALGFGGLLYCLYRLLVRLGVDSDMAALGISLGVAMMAALLAVATARQVRQLKRVSPPFVSRLQDIVDAFADGFKENH